MKQKQTMTEKESSQMKSKPILIVLAMLLMAGGTALATPRAFEQSTKPWLNRSSTKPEKGVPAAPSGTTIAMACPKCTSVTKLVKRDVGTKPGHGQQLVAVSVHQCAGCRDEMVRKQASKNVALVHACTDCGSQLANCCATTMDKVSTKGMI
jgi:predicted RNA-binding Zn-ribbon protein involved in translation (DUF1610 family)